jgi:hypothetical protein
MSRRYLDRHAETRLEALLRKEQQEQAAEEAEQQQQIQQRGMSAWNGLVEQRILDGMSKGMFDNLRGAGRPLNLDDDAFVPPELKMAFRMLRSTGLAPLWVEMNKEIREDMARMQRFREHVHSRWERISAVEHHHVRQQYLDRINDINSKIVNYNILAPSSQVHMALLIVDEELARFDNPQNAQG